MRREDYSLALKVNGSRRDYLLARKVELKGCLLEKSIFWNWII